MFRKIRLPLILMAVSSLLTFLVAETALFLLDAPLKLATYTLYSDWTEEQRFFHYLENAPAEKPPKHFDRNLGWRNFKNSGPDYSENLNSQLWRSPHEFTYQKQKPRVVLAGDSFVYGWKVNDVETISGFLQSELGTEFEVLNFGVRGFGLDQIALTALDIVPRYQPDFLVLGFIADDLIRSCDNFGFNVRKPYFDVESEQLQRKGVPVPTPFETYQEHQTRKAKLSNSFFTVAGKFRLVRLVAQVALQSQRNHCLASVNPRILKKVHDQWNDKTNLIFYHLDGALPPLFTANVEALGLSLLSAPPQVESIAQKLKVNVERHEDGHPKATLNQVYAHLLTTQPSFSNQVKGVSKNKLHNLTSHLRAIFDRSSVERPPRTFSTSRPFSVVRGQI